MANTKIPVELSSTPGIVDNSNATAITIDSSENVGIGTASPTGSGTILHLNGSSTVADFHLTNSTSGAASTDGFVLRYSGLNAEFLNREAGNNIFYTSGSERMRIDSSGNVGIGDSSPAAKLEIKQGSSNWYEGIRINRSDNTTQFGTFSNNSGATFIGAADTTGGSNNALLFGNSTDGTTYTERMRIDSSGILIVNNGGNSTGGIVNKYRSAITVGTTATNISNPTTYGGLAFVWVSSGGNIAHDLVSYSLSAVDVVASQTISGSPAGRTYSAASGILKVAMASGSYSVYATEIRVSTG